MQNFDEIKVVNSAYQYEDQDMILVLDLKISGVTLNFGAFAHALAPVNNATSGQLLSLLRSFFSEQQSPALSFGLMQLLIPSQHLPEARTQADERETSGCLMM